MLVNTRSASLIRLVKARSPRVSDSMDDFYEVYKTFKIQNLQDVKEDQLTRYLLREDVQVFKDYMDVPVADDPPKKNSK